MGKANRNKRANQEALEAKQANNAGKKAKSNKFIAILCTVLVVLLLGSLVAYSSLVTNGFQVIAAAAFIAEHSIVRSIAAGRPDVEDEALCRQFAADVMAKADDATPVQVPGNIPYKELKPAAFHPAANESCVKCGVCAERCPVGAIPLDDPGQTNNDLCINCMRCVQVCPVSSRALPEPFIAAVTGLLNEKAAGYKKPVVFL